MEKISRSVAERAQVLESYEASGLSASAFAARVGIPKGTLYNWLSKARRRATAPTQASSASPAPPVRVAKVIRTEAPIVTDDTSPVVIECSGVRVELGAAFNSAVLHAVLNVLEDRARGRTR